MVDKGRIGNNGFMPRSRDWALKMACKAKTCYLNNTIICECISPAVVQINEKGECEAYKNKANMK